MTLIEVKQRVTTMQARLQAKGVDGALFILAIDVFYFSGTRQNAILWIPVVGEPVLMVRKSLSRAKVESVLSDIRPFPTNIEFLSLVGDQVQKIGFTFDVAPVQQLNYYKRLLPGREFVDISDANREVRSVKSVYELEQLRKSGASLCSVFKQVPQFLRVGMSELDLSAEFEYRLRIAGNEGFIRMRAFNQELFGGLAISASAASYGFFDGAVTGNGLSSASPQGASRDVITINCPVLIDYTGVFNGYVTDMTRIYVVGELDPELQLAFNLSLNIQEHLRSSLKPGVICEELYQQAVEIAIEGGFGAYFMGMPGEQARFVGHGVGLELDEYPVLAQDFKVPLQSGQTIAIEPKFVFPGKGVIGIENTFAVSNDGGEKITDFDDEIIYIKNI